MLLLGGRQGECPPIYVCSSLLPFVRRAGSGSWGVGGPSEPVLCVCVCACVCAQLCGRASLQEASRQSGLSLPTDLEPGSTELAFQSFLGWTGTKPKLRIGWVVSLATWKHGWGRGRWEPQRRE